MSAPPTPYLRVDVARLAANIEKAAAIGVALRPHVKTHKCVEIARMQVAAGAQGITVATIGEAEAFVDAGFDDVFIAYPLWVDARAAERLRALADRARVTIGVDSVAGAANAGRLLGDRVSALVEVDSGHHRSGGPPQRAAEVAQAGVEVRGVFTFPGHSYAPDGRAAAAQDEARALAVAAGALRAAGIEPEVVSGGSTPSLADSDTGVLTELRPGVYVFNDAQQWELGTVGSDRIALTCRATVVSHAGGRLVLDSGSKLLGADRAAYATGFGRLLQHPDARVVQLSEHHAVVDLGGAPLPPLGSQVDVIPNHVCNAVNLVDELWADTGDDLLRWPVAGRGRNS
ncbi:alanine racemase [Nocardioides sp. SR21]|uniref:alanine racemase n=1 Tax=Nocardioides sp. SR21 TaxID=2919501 RepID=UPI001FAA1A0C|nr:alanine racemase [Nocardioides sp. SR21]